MRRAAILLIFAFGCHHQSDLPKLFPVPNAQLVDESGRRVALDSMKGYVTVYDFIFTHCAGTCPIMTANMRDLTKKVAKDAPVRFVSISIDPTRDTPPVLHEYAKRVRNDDRWIFLTGDRKDITNLSINGFKLAAGDPTPGGDPLLHSAKFAIADKTGTIREYYLGVDSESANHVAATIEDLLRE